MANPCARTAIARPMWPNPITPMVRPDRAHGARGCRLQPDPFLLRAVEVSEAPREKHQHAERMLGDGRRMGAAGVGDHDVGIRQGRRVAQPLDAGAEGLDPLDLPRGLQYRVVDVADNHLDVRAHLAHELDRGELRSELIHVAQYPIAPDQCFHVKPPSIAATHLPTCVRTPAASDRSIRSAHAAWTAVSMAPSGQKVRRRARRMGALGLPSREAVYEGVGAC